MSHYVEQAELIEEYEVLLKDQRVTFEFDPGKIRVGTVIGRSIWGPHPETGWVLSVLIRYRGTQSWRQASQVELA